MFNPFYHTLGTKEKKESRALDLQAIPDITKRNIFQEIIEEKYNDTEYVVDSYEKNEYAIKELMKKSHVDKGLFNPSYHVTDTENSNANALDIRLLEIDGKKYKETAEKVYNKNGGENRGYEGFDHYHMTY